MKTEISTKTLTAARRLRAVAAAIMAGMLGCSFAHAARGEAAPPSATHMSAGPSANTSTLDFHYLWLAGSTFHPLGDGAQFAYSDAGCIHTTGGTEHRVVHKVVLPQSATVKYVRLYTYDDAPSSDIWAFFTTYDGVGNFHEHETVSSTTTGGYNTTLSTEMNYLVDYYAKSINMVVNLGNETDDSLRFCGVRIAYVLDTIFADGFEKMAP